MRFPARPSAVSHSWQCGARAVAYCPVLAAGATMLRTLLPLSALMLSPTRTSRAVPADVPASLSSRLPRFVTLHFLPPVPPALLRSTTRTGPRWARPPSLPRHHQLIIWSGTISMCGVFCRPSFALTPPSRWMFEVIICWAACRVACGSMPKAGVRCWCRGTASQASCPPLPMASSRFMRASTPWREMSPISLVPPSNRDWSSLQLTITSSLRATASPDLPQQRRLTL
mmetsp:Transcript_9384/g.14960  ORF Transcript_9384/g.14960 Transcript_9384/m.14960 type:complete len:228 (-) Transcript_9384:3588-4271(-)